MKNALIFLAITASIFAQATDFIRLTDFTKLETGDEVVITMAYEGVVYALNGDDATKANPKSDTIAESVVDTLVNPDAKYVFTVNKEATGASFTRTDGLMLYQISSGIRVNTATNAKKNAYIWNVKDNYLYCTVGVNELFIGVYHREGDSYAAKNLKVFEHYQQSQDGWKKYINNEILTFYVNSPTGDPTKEKYAITVDNVEGGKLDVSYPIAGKDTRIEVNVDAHKGYDYVENSLKYIYNDGSQDVTMLIEDNQFLMPAYPVTVTAEFEGRSPSITIDFDDTNNLWQLPTTHTFGTNSYTYDGMTISLTGTGTDKTDGGYSWGKSNGGYLRIGKKNAILALPAFTFDVAKIVTAGKPDASAYTSINIYVGEDAVSNKTTGSKEENIYLINRESRAAGTQYNMTILNDYPAQFSTIDIYATVPNAPETPQTSVPAGLYNVTQNVKLSCYTEGATIHYTLDGSRPTEMSTTYSSGTLVVDHTMTIRAIAIKDGVKSEIMTAPFAIANVTTDGTLDNPYSVADIQKLGNPGYKAWVHGYIINGFDPNIKNRRLTNESVTALAIADNQAETDTTKMAFIELPQGRIRDSLNIVLHPTYVGKEVWIYGVLSKYGLQQGVTKTSKYYLDTLPVVPTYIEQSTINQPNTATKHLINGQLMIEYNGVWYSPTGTILQPIYK